MEQDAVGIRLSFRIRIHGSRKMIADDVRRPPQRVGVEVSIPGSRLRLAVSKQLADHGQPQARACPDRRERVPEIVQAHALEVSTTANRLPWPLKVGPGRFGILAQNYAVKRPERF